jgi:mannose/fructose/N-acetylgalactosamine-specific phosphotransferase system component IIC
MVTPLPELSGLGWLGLALLGALMAMDEHGLVQTWFSQPLPAGVLAGMLIGDVNVGLAAGSLMQLAVIGNLPVGASYSIDTPSATVGVTAGAVMAGWHVPDPFSLWTAIPGPDTARWGWILVLMTVASLIGGRLVHLERMASLGRMLDGYRSVRDGDLGRLARLHGRGLMVTGLRGALLSTVWALLTFVLWPMGPERMPPSILQALGLLPLLVPMLAFGSLWERYGHHQSALQVVGSAALAFILVRFIA